MSLTAREAGDRVGRSRQAIIKAIRKGRVSASKDDAGEWRIEPAELFRVYPPAASAGPADGNWHTPRDTADTAGLQREITLLRERLHELAEDRDRWRSQAEQALRLLTAPRASREAAHGLGWWRRLLGRS